VARVQRVLGEFSRLANMITLVQTPVEAGKPHETFMTVSSTNIIPSSAGKSGGSGVEAPDSDFSSTFLARSRQASLQKASEAVKTFARKSRKALEKSRKHFKVIQELQLHAVVRVHPNSARDGTTPFQVALAEKPEAEGEEEKKESDKEKETKAEADAGSKREASRIPNPAYEFRDLVLSRTGQLRLADPRKSRRRSALLVCVRAVERTGQFAWRSGCTGRSLYADEERRPAQMQSEAIMQVNRIDMGGQKNSQDGPHPHHLVLKELLADAQSWEIEEAFGSLRQHLGKAKVWGLPAREAKAEGLGMPISVQDISETSVTFLLQSGEVISLSLIHDSDDAGGSEEAKESSGDVAPPTCSKQLNLLCRSAVFTLRLSSSADLSAEEMLRNFVSHVQRRLASVIFD